MDRIRYLIDCALEGDDRAARELITIAQPAVTRVCATLGSGDDVEDLIQETFLRGFRSLGTFRGDGSAFLTWIVTVARNACATEVGRRNRRRGLEERLAGIRRDETCQLDEFATLDNLVQQLPPEQREAFVLTQLAALSYEEAAAVCGCPVGTIRSRVARARATLTAVLLEESG